jgi:hypothetical protein
MRYLVYVKLPGKMIEWKRGMFRTPLRLVMLNEKELQEFKVRLKAVGILENQYTVTPLDDGKKEVVKVEKTDKPLKDIRRESKEEQPFHKKKEDKKDKDDKKE